MHKLRPSRTDRTTRKLGQHLLVDNRILGRIIQAAEISQQESVCEIGTGLGILTAELCRVARSVISFELDRKMFDTSSASLLGRFPNLEMINSDAFRNTGVSFDVFVSNLPYSRSRDSIEWLASKSFKRAVIMVQSEFAAKLLAQQGQKDYRSISAVAGYCFKIERLFDVPRSSFRPPPSVESVVIRLTSVRALDSQTIKTL